MLEMMAVLVVVVVDLILAVMDWSNGMLASRGLVSAWMMVRRIVMSWVVVAGVRARMMSWGMVPAIVMRSVHTGMMVLMTTIMMPAAVVVVLGGTHADPAQQRQERQYKLH